MINTIYQRKHRSAAFTICSKTHRSLHIKKASSKSAGKLKLQVNSGKLAMEPES
jgi:hypothetical protein